MSSPPRASDGRNEPIQPREEAQSPASHREDVDQDDDEDASDDQGERKPSKAPSVNQTPAKPSAEQDAPSDAATPQYTATTTTTRRNANGSVSSVYSGNKIRHLKKEDGVPLWRKDIQYDFLKYVFEDDQKVFHKVSDGSDGNTFADIYLDAMAKSSKCSKILRDKLLTDRPAGVNMAMVCLLVNVGRMNTTLNFFPEMRAQLRTYHSIPSLQESSDTNAYKQLQDAPRLKSILKGATEDVEQPGTIEDIKAATIPRTNPVNLIFVLAQQAPKISEMHFDVPRDFFDLVMKEQLSSRSRATAFLWLMWWYLESDFSLEAALNNPYGPGRRSREAPDDDMPIKCPQFYFLSDDEAALENVDTPAELEYGEQKRQERAQIMNGEVTPLFSGPKRFNVQKPKYTHQNHIFALNSGNPGEEGASPSRDVNSPSASASKGASRKPVRVAPKQEYLSDSDQTRSASPPSRSKIRINNIVNDENNTPNPPSRSARSNPRRKTDNSNGDRSRASDVNASSALVPQSNSNNTNAETTSSNKRSRPPTSHQKALEEFRKSRVNHILDRGLREERHRADRKRRKEGPVERSWKRLRNMDPTWDSDEEAHTTGAGRIGAAAMGIGMAGYKQNDWEPADYGAEAEAVAQAFRRMFRRLSRHDDSEAVGLISKTRGIAGRRRRYSDELGDEMDLDEQDDVDETGIMTIEADDEEGSDED